MSVTSDLGKYPLYGVTPEGLFGELDINNLPTPQKQERHHIHHYIKQQDYKRNKEWFDSHGIKQKLFWIPGSMHEQLHFQAVKNMSDEEFEAHYKVSRWNLIFSRKHSKY